MNWQSGRQFLQNAIFYPHGPGNLSVFIFKWKKKNLKPFLCAQYNTSVYSKLRGVQDTQQPFSLPGRTHCFEMAFPNSMLQSETLQSHGIAETSSTR